MKLLVRVAAVIDPRFLEFTAHKDEPQAEYIFEWYQVTIWPGVYIFFQLTNCSLIRNIGLRPVLKLDYRLI